MSRTHELREGMRVKVVTSRCSGDEYVGETGVITGKYEYPDSFDWNVRLDTGEESWFYGDELAALSTTVIEGVVDTFVYGHAHINVGDTDVVAALVSIAGKRVRVTIEVLADSADSQSQVSAVGDAEGDEGGDGR